MKTKYTGKTYTAKHTFQNIYEKDGRMYVHDQCLCDCCDVTTEINELDTVICFNNVYLSGDLNRIRIVARHFLVLGSTTLSQCELEPKIKKVEFGMICDIIYKESEKHGPNIKDMVQDLRAMGKTQDEIDIEIAHRFMLEGYRLATKHHNIQLEYNK